MKKYLTIKSDVFNINKRIKSINKNYFVVFNKKLKRLEVHNKKFAKSPTEFVLPYKNLNKKTLQLILKNLKKSNKQKVNEINIHNEKIEKSIHTKELEERNYKLNEIFVYANKGSKEYDADSSYKNVWF